jgi:tRNA (guanosine-2'-O-)-methyltransferase
MTPERIARLRQVLNQRQTTLAVMTDHVHKGRNLSAIMRNCDAVGINELHCVVNDKEYRAFRGTAMGSNQWVNVVRHASITEAIAQVKQQGMQIVAAHVDHRTVDYRDIDYSKPTAILMGAEKDGVSDQSIDAADHLIKIPMAGMVESYNVSVASGIILEEARYQRAKAGLYDSRQLNDDEFETQFFEWAYPKLARFCQQHQVAYPPLDSEGHLHNPSAWYSQHRLKNQHIE